MSFRNLQEDREEVEPWFLSSQISLPAKAIWKPSPDLIISYFNFTGCYVADT